MPDIDQKFVTALENKKVKQDFPLGRQQSGEGTVLGVGDVLRNQRLQEVWCIIAGD